MDINKLKRISLAKQAAADLLFDGLPDRPRFDVRDGGIWYSLDLWSPALCRMKTSRRFDQLFVLNYLEYFSPELDAAASKAARDDDWDAYATIKVGLAFGDIRTRQVNRAESARLLGLITEGGCRDLEAAELRIDRLLLKANIHLRTAEGLMQAAKAALAQPCTTPLDVNDHLYEHHAPGTRSTIFTISHRDRGAPVISNWIDLGHVLYNGWQVELPGTLPESAAAAAIGRRVGDLVDTRNDQLNARRIVDVDPNSYPIAAPTNPSGPNVSQIRLETDLVTLGTALRT